MIESQSTVLLLNYSGKLIEVALIIVSEDYHFYLPDREARNKYRRN